HWHPWGIGWPRGRWSLAADTLRLDDDRNTSITYKVVLKDGRLFLWNWLMWEEGRRDEKCAEKIFEHFEASTPLVVPPPLETTIPEAELVGTWAGTMET